MMKSLVNGMRTIYVHVQPIPSISVVLNYTSRQHKPHIHHTAVVPRIKPLQCFAQLFASQPCVPYSKASASQAQPQPRNPLKQKPDPPNKRTPKTEKIRLLKRRPWLSSMRSFARKCLVSQGMEEKPVSSWRVVRYVLIDDDKSSNELAVTDFFTYQPVSMKRSVRENMFRYI